jgi:hypothetical protein
MFCVDGNAMKTGVGVLYGTYWDDVATCGTLYRRKSSLQ